MTSSLLQRVVSAVKREVVPGTAETLVDADTFETLATPSLSPDLGEIEREHASGTATMKEVVAGLASGTYEVPMELAGRNLLPAAADPSVEPVWAPFLEAAYMKQTPVVVCKMGIVSAAGATNPNMFAHNEVLTFAASTATGRCVGHFRGAEHVWLFVEELSGTIVDGDATATGTSGTVIDAHGDGMGANAGIAWEPWDLCEQTVAMVSGSDSFVVGEEILGGTSKARGRVTVVSATASTPLRFETYLGSPLFAADETITGQFGGSGSGVVAAVPAQAVVSIPTLTYKTWLSANEIAILGGSANVNFNLTNGDRGLVTASLLGKHPSPIPNVSLTGPTKLSARPIKVAGTRVRFWTGAPSSGLPAPHLPCYTTLVMRTENEPALRQCAQDDTGYASSFSSKRSWVGDIDPELLHEGLYPLMGNAYLKTAFSFETEIGDPSLAAGNSFIFRSEGAQARNYTQNDRSRLATLAIPLAFRGTIRDEFFIYAA